MTTAIIRLTDADRPLPELAAEIRHAHRSHLRELHLEVVLGGVVIRGVAVSYYGKQLAFHEVRRLCRLAIVANQIEVEVVSKTVSLPEVIGG